jgi:hypothetical protein
MTREGRLTKEAIGAGCNDSSLAACGKRGYILRPGAEPGCECWDSGLGPGMRLANGKVRGIGGAGIWREEGDLAGSQIAAGGGCRHLRWGAWGPMQQRLGRPSQSSQFELKTGGTEPFLNRGALCGIKGLDEAEGLATAAAGLLATSPKQEFSAEAGVWTVGSDIKWTKVAAETKELFAIINDGSPGWWDRPCGHVDALCGGVSVSAFPGTISILWGFLTFGWVVNGGGPVPGCWRRENHHRQGGMNGNGWHHAHGDASTEG